MYSFFVICLAAVCVQSYYTLSFRQNQPQIPRFPGVYKIFTFSRGSAAPDQRDTSAAMIRSRRQVKVQISRSPAKIKAG